MQHDKYEVLLKIKHNILANQSSRLTCYRIIFISYEKYVDLIEAMYMIQFWG